MRCRAQDGQASGPTMLSEMIPYSGPAAAFLRKTRCPRLQPCVTAMLQQFHAPIAATAFHRLLHGHAPKRQSAQTSSRPYNCWQRGSHKRSAFLTSTPPNATTLHSKYTRGVSLCRQGQYARIKCWLRICRITERFRKSPYVITVHTDAVMVTLPGAHNSSCKLPLPLSYILSSQAVAHRMPAPAISATARSPSNRPVV